MILMMLLTRRSLPGTAGVPANAAHGRDRRSAIGDRGEANLSLARSVE